jgi:hypothetical protein
VNVPARLLTPSATLPELINIEADFASPARDIGADVVINDPIVPPVTTTETPALVPVAMATEVATKEIFPPAWITPVLAIPPTTEVPIEETLEPDGAAPLTPPLVAFVSATQPTDDNATGANSEDNCTAVGRFGVPSVSALVPITSELAWKWEFAGTTVALATGAETTVNKPAVRADTATSAIRCLIVFVDICILSLVRLRIS